MAGILVVSLLWAVWLWWVLRRLVLPKLAKPNKQPQRQASLSQSLYAPQTPRTWRTVTNPYLDAPQTPPTGRTILDAPQTPPEYPPLTSQPRQASLSQSIDDPQSPPPWNPPLWNPLLWQEMAARGKLHQSGWTEFADNTPGGIGNRAAGLDMLDRFLGGK